MNTNKVVYNDCFGGFSLSNMAMEWLLKNAREEVVIKVKDHLKESENDNWHHIYLDRHDPDLVRCVETLGTKANGQLARLKVRVLSGNKYRVDEYDGWEKIYEPCDEEYIEIDRKEAEK